MITTERLTLRAFTSEDADFVFDIFGRPEVARWSGGGQPMTCREEAVERLAQQPERIGDHPAAGIFAVTPREAPTPVGMVMLVPIPASAGVDRQDMEIGWHFLPESWGQGYATESALAIVDRAFASDLEEVYAVTDPVNDRSQRLCRRLGMADLGLSSSWYDTELRAFHLPRP